MWITRQLWSLVTVTIVAQVFTFPLGLYYFRQFPTYFLLSNLVVIPLSTITMYAGLILLIVSPIAFLAKYIAVVFSFLVSLLNSSVESIEQLPSPVMRSAAWSGTELALLYASIVSFLVYLAARKVRLLQVSLGIFFAMLVLMLFNRDSRFDEQQMVFFRLKNSTAIAVLDNGRHILLTDTTLVAKKGDMDFHVDPFFETHGLYNPNLHVLSNDSVINEPFVHAGKNWIHAGGKKIFIADRSIKKAATKTSCDILLLKDNTSCRLDSLISYLHPEMVVADGSDGKKKTEKWKAICERRKVKFYDVKEGALVLWR
jgi:competence protein ComEC